MYGDIQFLTDKRSCEWILKKKNCRKDWNQKSTHYDKFLATTIISGLADSTKVE